CVCVSVCARPCVCDRECYLVSAVPICARRDSHCSLLCHERPVCSARAGQSGPCCLSLTVLSLSLSLSRSLSLSACCHSEAHFRLLSFSARVSFRFTRLASAPTHTHTHTHQHTGFWF